MKILSHRGYWKEPDERNSNVAFMRSLDLGFGLETDIRDCAGQLVVSHDMPTGNELSFERLLRMFHNRALPLALNIKADGLADPIRRSLQENEVKDWFVFDMSVPDMRCYLDAQMPVFVRMSEVETETPWIGEVVGIWWDSFDGGNCDISRVAAYLQEGKRVCLVSPELHNRPYQAFWKAIETLRDQPELMLCTDFPEQASEFFATHKL